FFYIRSDVITRESFKNYYKSCRLFDLLTNKGKAPDLVQLLVQPKTQTPLTGICKKVLSCPGRKL
ncbi:MAG: hypothetical protein J6T22_12915, partial [Bacteroidales bacterium]|nr:hypothetical protein [Bacteroidales bacterium]